MIVRGLSQMFTEFPGYWYAGVKVLLASSMGYGLDSRAFSWLLGQPYE